MFDDNASQYSQDSQEDSGEDIKTGIIERLRQGVSNRDVSQIIWV